MVKGYPSQLTVQNHIEQLLLIRLLINNKIKHIFRFTF